MEQLARGKLLAGRFLVQELLGRGGAGAVWAAEDRALGRPVALKELQPGRDPRRLERFRREAALMAQVVHPGVVRLHEVLAVEGREVLVCERVEGARPLDEAVVGLPWSARVALLRDAAAALGAAHARGIVHRDVKPGNVLVDAAGRVRVADFGLAAHAELERLTRTGELVGTPWYMAPEQLAGEGEPGPPCDVWALGVTGFQALTGELPFPGQSLREVIAQVLAAPVPRLRQLDPALPPALERVMDRALERDPARRLPDGGALARALEEVLAGGDPFPAPRRRGVALAAGAGSLLALGLLAWALRAPAADAPAPATVAAPSPETPAQSPEELLARGDLLGAVERLAAEPRAEVPGDALAEAALRAGGPPPPGLAALLPRVRPGEAAERLRLALVVLETRWEDAYRRTAGAEGLLGQVLQRWGRTEVSLERVHQDLLATELVPPSAPRREAVAEAARVFEDLERTLPRLPQGYARALVERLLERLLRWDFLVVEDSIRTRTVEAVFDGPQASPARTALLPCLERLAASLGPRSRQAVRTLDVWLKEKGSRELGPSERGGADRGTGQVRLDWVAATIARRDALSAGWGPFAPGEMEAALVPPPDVWWQRYRSLVTLQRELLKAAIGRLAGRVWEVRGRAEEADLIALAERVRGELVLTDEDGVELAACWQAQLALQLGEVTHARALVGAVAGSWLPELLLVECDLLQGEREDARRHLARLQDRLEIVPVRGVAALARVLEGQPLAQVLEQLPPGRPDTAWGWLLPWRQGEALRRSLEAAARGWSPAGPPPALLPPE